MKSLVVLAIILAILGAGCLIAELIVGNPIAEIWLTIATCLSLAAFIIVIVAYANKASN